MEKASRPQRIRRHSRRAWPDDDFPHQSSRPAKRLFTPEIKRMLKDWLIRRRENPYPSRDEKKRLAIDTGLTYTQICNWFANWRRKLKNSERERATKSWGHLIKHYNTNARGNVEQFSISSEDSIWGSQELLRRSNMDSHDDDSSASTSAPDYYTAIYGSNGDATIINAGNEHCHMNLGPAPMTVVVETGVETDATTRQTFTTHKTKYKQQIMEKYLRDMRVQEVERTAHVATEATELSKWLESAAKFTPDKNNYFVEWNNNRRNQKADNGQRLKQFRRLHSTRATRVTGTQDGKEPQQRNSQQHLYDTIHQKDELDAAEALANLAFNCRRRMLDASGGRCTAINAITTS